MRVMLNHSKVFNINQDIVLPTSNVPAKYLDVDDNPSAGV